jgi:hypothetical protein
MAEATPVGIDLARRRASLPIQAATLHHFEIWRALAHCSILFVLLAQQL